MIYVTHYNTTTQEIIGNSVDSGFTSIDDVIAAMQNWVIASRTVRRVSYNLKFNDSLVFSNYAFKQA